MSNKPNGDTTDCREPAGIATGLVDGIMSTARVLRRHYPDDISVEALKDLANDSDVRWLLEIAAAVSDDGALLDRAEVDAEGREIAHLRAVVDCAQRVENTLRRDLLHTRANLAKTLVLVDALEKAGVSDE